MLGFTGNVLSAADLTTYRFRTEQELPEKGPREFKPVNIWLENEQLKAAVDERLQLVAEERVSRLGTLARAEWNDQMKEALVTTVVGRHWQLFGHERKTRIWLYPEEALFLLECGCLELIHNGMAMSLQQAYITLLSPNTSCTLSEYRTYAHLLRHGYRVLRHAPATKSVHSDSQRAHPNSYTHQKKHHVWPVLGVVDISDSKPKPSRLPSIADTSINSSPCVIKERSASVKSTSFNQRTESFDDVNEIICVNHKPVSKIQTEEADVTLVYEQKGPVLQSCLKPKGSLVLFPDSQIESLSSSRKVNVTPIDIDDNELEISYVNKNVSVTLSPQKKDRQNDMHKDLPAEVVLDDSSKETSLARLGVEYEEQSVSFEEGCSSTEDNVHCENLEAMEESCDVKDVVGRAQVASVIPSDDERANVEVLRTEGNETHVETLEDSSHCRKVSDSDSMTTENVKPLASGSGKTVDLPLPDEDNLNCKSNISVMQTIEGVATSSKTLFENEERKPEITAVVSSELNAQRTELDTKVFVFNKGMTDVDSNSVAVEKKVDLSRSFVKFETEDVIEIQDIDCNSHNVTSSITNACNVGKNMHSSKVKTEWQGRQPKLEDADVEIICDTVNPNFMKDIKRKVTTFMPRQNAHTDSANKNQGVAETGWKQSVNTVSIKPDIEIVCLQESSGTSGELEGIRQESATRKRGRKNSDVKEEYHSAQTQLVNSNNWLQDSTETLETSPSGDQQVIDVEEYEGKLTEAERRAVLDAIPSIENKFTIHVQAPKQELLPPNVKPKQKNYYIQLWRLKANGFGGGPARAIINHTDSFAQSQPVRQTHLRPENSERMNPWLPTATFQQPVFPMMGFGGGLLPHPMFAQAIMMAQSLAVAQSMAMNFGYRMPHHFFRGRYLHRPYFRRGYKRRYNNTNRNVPYHRNQGQSNTSYQVPRNFVSDDSSEPQSHSVNVNPARNLNQSIGDDLPIVIEVDDEPSEKQRRKRDSDDDVIECYEVAPSMRGSSRKRRGVTRRSARRYFAPAKKQRMQVEKMWLDERSDIEEIPVFATSGRLAAHAIKHERKSIEVILSSDEELLDDNISERGSVDVVDESNGTEVVSCLQPENCRSVDTVLSRLQIFQQGKKPRNMANVVGRKELKITFDLYLPSMSFRKTTPGLPDYRIVVFSQEHFTSNDDQSVPTLGDISWALKDFDDCVPLLLAQVAPDSIQFFLFARIDLPVAPGIVCDVL